MKAIDLFSGCGGFSLGFQNAGIEIAAAFDNWKQAAEVYAANFAHPVFQVDLLDIEDAGQFKEWSPDIIIGGPPCQDFSSAGKRDETSGRASLTRSYANIISKVKPEWFVMENVERIIKSRILPEILLMFTEIGYGLAFAILNACYCGVPQHRKRFIIVGHLHSNDGFLNKHFVENQSDTPMTVQDYMGEKLDFEFYYRHPRSYARRGVFSIYEPSPTIRGINRPVPKNYKRHKGDLCDPSEVRSLTARERSYIQTFPEGFKWLGTKTCIEQMIGNAVPVKMGQYVAECILQYIRNKDCHESRLGMEQLELFPADLLLNSSRSVLKF